MICSVPACSNRQRARGLCNKHYQEHAKLGTLDEVSVRIPSTLATAPRLCSWCGLEKPIEKFGRYANSSGGRRPYCLDCANDAARERRANDPDGAIAYKRSWRSQNTERSRGYSERWSRNNVAAVLLAGARRRARIASVPYSLTLGDLPTIPDRCPVVGCSVTITRGIGVASSSSLTLDRLIPAFGYVPGNVMWMCHGCNRGKQNLSAEQHEFFARIMREAEAKLRHFDPHDHHPAPQ